jgi:hypothetical protein
MASKFDKPYRNVVLPDINKINTILSESVEIDTQKILQLSLINKIPLPIVIDNNGNNLIHIAINNLNKKSEFNILNYIKFLVQQQVNPDQPNKENQTPLHLACQNQYLDIVNFLVEQQVNVNYQDNNGLTPLHYLLTGNIKVYDEKEITEFIVPKLEKKTSKDERIELLQLKKELWNILKGKQYNLFFESIEKTIIENIKNSSEIKVKIVKIKEDLSNIDYSDLKKSSEYYLKYRQDIEEIILKKWNTFASSKDIVLNEEGSLLVDEKIGFIKERIKNNIRKSIDEGLELINKYNYTIPTNNLNEDLSELLSNTLFNQPLSLQLINNLDKLYKNNSRAFDYADNIIDNLFFFGGSRQVTIDVVAGVPDHYDMLKKKLFRLTDIKKKVIFILLIEYFKLYNFVPNDNIRDPVFNIIDRFKFENNIDGLFNQLALINVNHAFYDAAAPGNAVANAAAAAVAAAVANADAVGVAPGVATVSVIVAAIVVALVDAFGGAPDAAAAAAANAANAVVIAGPAGLAAVALNPFAPGGAIDAALNAVGLVGALAGALAAPAGAIVVAAANAVANANANGIVDVVGAVVATAVVAAGVAAGAAAGANGVVVAVNAVVMRYKYEAILNIAKQSYKEIFENNNQVSNKNLGQRIYSRYLNTISQYTPGTNLDHNLHKLFFKLIAALNNYRVDLEKSLNNVFKIDILATINPIQDDSVEIKKNKLAVWTGFLLKKDIQLDDIDNLD